MSSEQAGGPARAMRRGVQAWLMAAGIAAATGGMAGTAVAQDFDAMPIETLRAEITDFHPAAYYVLAMRLMGAGDEDEAVFWFYAGQLRYRVLLSCEAAPAQANEGVLFNALSETVGRPINEYAFGDIDTLVATIDDVLAWDVAEDGGPISKQDCAETFAEVRAGLVGLRDEVVAGADEIRRQRTRNGLENRT